jgi:hypothetical protein
METQIRQQVGFADIGDRSCGRFRTRSEIHLVAPGWFGNVRRRAVNVLAGVTTCDWKRLKNEPQAGYALGPIFTISNFVKRVKGFITFFV